MTLVRNDDRAPGREPGHHAYDVLIGDRLMGFVVSRSTPLTQKREWLAYRPMPSRTQPWGVVVIAGTRRAAADRLTGGRP